MFHLTSIKDINLVSIKNVLIGLVKKKKYKFYCFTNFNDFQKWIALARVLLNPII